MTSSAFIICVVLWFACGFLGLILLTMFGRKVDPNFVPIGEHQNTVILLYCAMGPLLLAIGIWLNWPQEDE